MCDEIKLSDGSSLLLCGLRAFRKFCACGRQATLLCDWKVAAHKSGTCDRPICARHAKQVAPGKHLCPLHQQLYDRWRREHPDRKFSIDEQRSLFEDAA
jgi:hypothetical protein